MCVRTGPVLDFAVQYDGHAAKPALWLLTEVAWYRLLAPADSYRATFLRTQQLVAASGACARLLSCDPAAGVDQVQQAVADALSVDGDTAPDVPVLLKRGAAFLSGQLLALHSAGQLGTQQQQQKQQPPLLVSSAQAPQSPQQVLQLAAPSPSHQQQQQQSRSKPPPVLAWLQQLAAEQAAAVQQRRAAKRARVSEAGASVSTTGPAGAVKHQQQQQGGQGTLFKWGYGC